MTHAFSADEAYKAIRANNADVARSAETTGLKPRNIRKVKDYIFNEPHLLDRYVNLGEPTEFHTFDSDLRIADAWERLQAGSFTSEDRELLRHGPSYTAAHDAAHARFPLFFASLPVR